MRVVVRRYGIISGAVLFSGIHFLFCFLGGFVLDVFRNKV